MADFLLIHGAWHGAWCWDPLIASLQRSGHRARAIDLPGMGADATPPGQIDLHSWAQRVVQALQTYETPPVLVGHSMGGMVITAAIDIAPELVATAVYLCAFLPQSGESLYELASRPEGAATKLAQEATADGICTTVGAETARRAFYNCCDTAEADRAAARLVPQPLKPVMETLQLTHPPGRAVRTVYIECARDQAMPLALQEFMSTRIYGLERHRLDTDHSPFLSQTEALASLLDRIALSSRS